jgi:uridine phosphorylase
MRPISEADLILNKDGSVYHLSLLPDHIGDTVITVGDPDRVPSVSKYFDTIDFEIRKREFVTHGGRLGGKKIAVISTGMGTDNIEIFFTELDALVNVNLKSRLPKTRRKKLRIIRIGTSGSLQKNVPLDSHVASVYAIGLDNLMHFYDFEMNSVEKGIAKDIKRTTGIPFLPYVARASASLLETIAFDMIQGNTVTTPGFYAPQCRTVRLVPKYPRLLHALTKYHGRTTGLRLTNFEMETAGYYSMAQLLGHETLSVNAIVANRVEKKFSTQSNEVIDNLIKKVLNRL